MGNLPEPRTDEGRAGLRAIVGAPARALLAFDFDGTLAPIVEDPALARAHPDAVPALARLAGRVAAVAIVTGRPAEVAVRLGGFEAHPELAGLVVLGAYGAERWEAATGELSVPPPHPGIAAARLEVHAWARRTGAHLEDKGNALALHTRRAPDPDGAFAALREPMDRVAASRGLVVEPGRQVLELRPPGMDKGAALTALVREKNAGAVLYAGDDLGDLAAFEAVATLRASDVPGLRVCSGSAEVPRLAEATDLTVPGPAGLAAFLGELADAMGG
ncbi:trehalose-phosphatase [Streptomyces millisiae]|uniref:Trehalose 6-phosphate phosphatase n=1 Tax=Streptomyces millisiae TaxID=3075542 RepID=A0ABU2M101_9ACTN|nr:trehalose-phosphatase [Streptomyces sp. DSM 44918]MDT0323535.1 trehalose-phosphatase [Streptomyces sp. DSM 44918]